MATSSSTAGGILRYSSLAASRRAPSPKKRVQFSLTQEMFPSVEVDCSNFGRVQHGNAMCSLWWSAYDIEVFKWETSLQVEQAALDDNLRSCISKGIDSAARVASRSKSESKLQQKLRNIKADPSLSWWSNSLERGIEKFLRRTVLKNSAHLGRHVHRTMDYRKAVVAQQGKLTDKQMRDMCLNLSRHDRVFARMLGEADAQFAISKDFLHSSSSPVNPLSWGAISSLKLTNPMITFANMLGSNQDLRKRQFTSNQA